eukprot:679053-Lingulodinium_polyedra.AAC.1
MQLFRGGVRVPERVRARCGGDGGAFAERFFQQLQASMKPTGGAELQGRLLSTQKAFDACFNEVAE